MNKNEAVMNMLSKKLGITPQKLQEAINKKDFSMATENISQKDKETLKLILKNKDLMKKIMDSKEAKDLKSNL